MFPAEAIILPIVPKGGFPSSIETKNDDRNVTTDTIRSLIDVELRDRTQSCLDVSFGPAER